MKPKEPVDPPPITLRRHPPERRLIRALARGEVAAHCCTCCCCLHSLGSLVGAVAGSFFPREHRDAGVKPSSDRLRDDEIDGPPEPAPGRAAGGRDARSIYWWVALGASLLVCMCMTALAGPEGLPAGLFALALALPAVLLGGSVLAACFFAAIPEMRRDRAAWARLGWITLGTVVGGGLGLLFMYLYAVAIGR
jgi:hypothetical protein